MADPDAGFLKYPLDQLADEALTAMRGIPGIEYGDLRVHRDLVQWIHVREQELISLSDSQPRGFGVRLIVDGSFGYAAASELSPEAVVAAVRDAAAMAASLRSLLSERVELATEPPHRSTWVAPREINPFSILAEEKIALMRDATAAALGAGAKFAEFYIQQAQENRFFVSLEGSRILQERVRVHPVLEVGMLDEGGSGLVETMRSLARPAGEGWEHVRGHGFKEDAPQLVELLREKLAAPAVDPGRHDLVIDPSNLWLTIHESVAHGTELDRALGYEANFAGTTFATPDRVGSLHYGSPLMHVTGDRVQPLGLATVGYDDEGVEAQSWDLIREGVLVGYQLNRQMAHRFNLERSNGCAFSDSWAHVPLQRMPNVSLQPDPEHDTTLEDLIGEVDDGIYIVGDKSWSIDQQRYNFQFTGQRFYRIRKGHLAGQLRDVAYQSRTPDFWASMVGIGGRSSWRLEGAMNCGKGQPEQVAPVSHGCPPALFRGVNVLNTRSEGR